MKTATKILSMLLLVAMCLSLMGGSAYATNLGAPQTNSTTQQTGTENQGQEQGLGQGNQGLNQNNQNLNQNNQNLNQGNQELNQNNQNLNPDDQNLNPDNDEHLIGKVFGQGIGSLFSAIDPGTDDTKVEGSNGNTYPTVSAAVAAGETTITVKESVTETAPIAIPNNVTININSGVTWNTGSNTITIGGNVDIAGSGTLTYTTPIVVNGTLNLSCNVNNTSGAGFSGNGKVTINGGNYKIVQSFFTGNVTVVRGKFPTNAVPGNGNLAENSSVGADGTVTNTKSVASYNGYNYESIQAAINAVSANSTGTVTVTSSQDSLPSGSITVDNGKNITLDMSGQEINCSITVNSGTLTLRNGGSNAGSITINGGKVTATGSDYVGFSTVTILNGGSFTSNGTRVNIGTIYNNEGCTLNFSAGTVTTKISANGTTYISGGTIQEITGSTGSCVSGGTFNSKPDAFYIAPGYTVRQNGSQYIVEASSSITKVTPANSGIYTYFIDTTAGSGTTLAYNSTAAANSITMYDTAGNSITLRSPNDYSYTTSGGKYVYTLNLSNLAAAGTLRADRYTVSFAFNDGVDADQYIYVLPKVLTSNMSYRDGNTQMPTFTLSNAAPNGYSYTKNGNRYFMVEGVDYTVSADGKTVVLTNSLLTSKLGTGNYEINFEYDDGNYYVMGTVSVNTSSNPDDGSIINPGKASVWPANESTWYSGNGMFYFYVQPNLMLINAGSYKYYEVAVDGALVGGDKISYTAGSQRFGIASSYMDNLAPGAHKMSVRTTNGYASCNFYIGATLRPVDTDKHVIGSSRTLSFVCSEPISSVYVGGTQLVNYYDDYYTLSNSRRTITLSAAFLNARTAGNTYTLSVVTDSGSQPSCTFQILTRAQASASPQTGDESNLALWAAVLILSGGAVVAVLPQVKKMKSR